MGATYLRPLEVEIQIAFSFGLSGSLSMSIFLLLFSPTRPVWFGMIFFFPLLLSIPFLTLNCDPTCVLFGECVGFSPSRRRQHLPPSLQGTLRNLSHLLLRDGLACVWYTDVPRAAL